MTPAQTLLADPSSSVRTAGSRLSLLGGSLIAVPYDDDSDGGGTTWSSLPDSFSGLIVGLAALAALTWTCAAALTGGIDPRWSVLLVIAELLLLLIAPSAAQPRSRALSRRAVAWQYAAFLALSLLAWSSLLRAPELTWAAMAATAVLQSGYTAGVGLVALQERLQGNDHE